MDSDAALPPAADAASNGAERTGGTNDTWPLVAQVAGAVAAGIGVLGFVTAFGGGVVYARARALNLPPTEVVGLVPKEVLISIGAAFLVPALGAAAVVVAILLLVDAALDWTGRRRVNRLQEAADSIALEAKRARDRVHAVADAAEELTSAAEEVTKLRARDKAVSDSQTRDLREMVKDVVDRAHRLEEREEEIAELEHQAAAAEVHAEYARRALEYQTGRDRVIRVTVGAAVLALVQIVVAGVFASELPVAQVAVLVIIALVTSLLSTLLWVRSGRVAAFLAAAFMSAGAFAAVFTYDRTIARPKAEPTAALRTNRTAIAAFFIARSDDHTYLASLPNARGGSHVIAIPADEVERLTVGPMLSPATAATRARTMAQALCNEMLRQERDVGVSAAVVPAVEATPTTTTQPTASVASHPTASTSSAAGGRCHLED